MLYSVLTMNEGSYICNASNSAGADEWPYQVHVVPLSSTYNHHHNIIPEASSADHSQVFPSKRGGGGKSGAAAITDPIESEFFQFINQRCTNCQGRTN